MDGTASLTLLPGKSLQRFTKKMLIISQNINYSEKDITYLFNLFKGDSQ